MKTKRTIRASFSADDHVLDVRLPTSWSELTQPELHAVYNILAYSSGQPMSVIAMKVFIALTGTKILSSDGDVFSCSMPSMSGGKRRRIIFRVTPEQMAEMLEPLSFLSDPGHVPVRIESWRGAKAIDAQFHGLSFGEYLQVENLYQGYISSQDNRAPLGMLASILYPGVENVIPDGAMAFGIIQWLVQLKALFADNWPHFFRPATGTVSAPSMLEVMNNEIRALTGGDVTKEEVVFAADCWRALTELDFKAKDAEERERQLAKIKS